MDRLTVPVAEHGVELEDDGLLVGGDLAPLQVRPEVVHPPQPAALPAPPQPCSSTSSPAIPPVSSLQFIVSNNTTTLNYTADSTVKHKSNLNTQTWHHLHATQINCIYL